VTIAQTGAGWQHKWVRVGIGAEELSHHPHGGFWAAFRHHV